MPKIVLKPRNVGPEELEGLAAAVRDIASSYEVEILPKDAVDRVPGRFSVTWVEVVQILLPYTADAATVAAFAIQAVRWARHRFKNQEAEETRKHEDDLADYERRRQAEYRRRGSKPKLHIARRPTYVEILGPNGDVLKAVLIKDPESEPEDRTPDRDS